MATAAPVTTPTKVLTGKVRLSYVHLFEKFSNIEGAEPKYSAVIMVPKEDTKTYKALRRAQKAALQEGAAKKFGGVIPKDGRWKDTIKDGDEDADLEKNPEYEGHYYLTVSNTTKPAIVDRDRDPILDASEVYSGCYARVSLNAFAFNAGGSKGVSFGLQAVQKLGDGEPFGGGGVDVDVEFGDDFEDDLL